MDMSSRRRRIPRVARAAGALDRASEFQLDGGVGGPRAHASRIASTSAFSAAKFRSAVAAGDGSPSAMAAGDCSGPGGGGSDGSSVVGMARALLTGTPGRARGFAEAAVDGSSSLSLVSRLMVMIIFAF